jgi:hypothetical protein
MSTTPRILQLAAAVLVGAALGGGGYAIAASGSGTTIHGCVNKRTHQLVIQRKCTRRQRPLSWNQRGPAGPAGAQGAAGAAGPAGAQGPPGPRGQNAVSAWEVVNAQGGLVAATNLGITHVATGDYQLNHATGDRFCAIQVTPDNNSNGVTVPPILASVGNAFPVQEIFMTNNSGTPLDDGFSVSVQC